MSVRVLAVFALLLLCAGGGLLTSLIFRPSAKHRAKQLDCILRRADLAVDDESRARLERQASRRGKWGAIGSGIGFVVMLPIGSLVGSARLGENAGLLALGGTFLSLQIGAAVSVLRPVDRPSNRIRLSALQPHGLRDYLRRRDLVAEITFACLGSAAILLGLTAIARSGNSPMWSWLAVVLGAMVSASAVTALLLQRRLLAAPRAAGDDSQLVVNDVILAIGLNDLVAASFLTTFFAGCVAVLVLTNSYWYVGLYFIGCFGILQFVFKPKSRPDMAPVAHRLAAATQ